MIDSTIFTSGESFDVKYAYDEVNSTRINGKWKKGKVARSAEEVVCFEYSNSSNTGVETRWIKAWHDRIAPAGSMTETEQAKFYETLQGYAAKDQAFAEGETGWVEVPQDKK